MSDSYCYKAKAYQPEYWQLDYSVVEDICKHPLYNLPKKAYSHWPFLRRQNLSNLNKQ